MKESAHRPLSERVDDMADVGAIRFGKLWLDKEDKYLHWPEANKVAPLGPNEAEIMRLLIAVSHKDTNDGGIVSTAEFQRWFDESRRPNDEKLTSATLIWQTMKQLNKKLHWLTEATVSIEIEGKKSGARGYFLKANRA